MAHTPQPQASQVGRLLNSVPVGLKEAAIDSPTSRSTIVHFSEQVELIEKWLEEYVKATNRLVTECITLETVLSSFSSHAILPITISESIVDHDYTLLAMKKHAESAKDFWMSMVMTIKKLTSTVIEPIRVFLLNDIRTFKEARRSLDLAQKNFDIASSKYAALSKTKEPSFLREEAFQLYEARKVYLKASMDYSYMAPQLRFTLDKLLIRIFTDQFKEMRNSRDNAASSLQRNTQEIERVQGWVREMEESEKSFRRDLHSARKQLEDVADSFHRPSRELEDYAVFTVAHLGTISSSALQRSPQKTAVSTGEKQGWLHLRTYTGRPTRVQWVRRWAFVRSGVFGFLVFGGRSGSVEESERIGVLLCSARPAPTEERRFCFEVKTNKNSIFLQAETQNELASWLGAFEAAKSKALENPAANDTLASAGHAHLDPAFAISAPPVPEFGTSVLPSLEPGVSDEPGATERPGSLPVSAADLTRESADLARRPTGPLGDESGKEHSSKIMSKLETLRKVSATPAIGSPATPAGVGGIASLIAASHGSMPVGPNVPLLHSEPDASRPKQMFRLAPRDMPPSTLAPSTLVIPPTPTNMSKAAVVVTGERRITATADKIGIPNSLLANTWGSSNQWFVNRLAKSEARTGLDAKLPAPSPLALPVESVAGLPAVTASGTAGDIASISSLDLSAASLLSRSRTPSPDKRHRSTISLDTETAKQTRVALSTPAYPNYYPLQLKTQDAQFRLLFPSVRQDERLVLVFRASWDPNDNQEFPGRAYVTTREIYFYSHHLGLVMTSRVPLGTIDEVTGAPGRDSDFLFLHMSETRDNWTPTRITIKTFLEPLRLLQRRLNFLVKNNKADDPLDLENIIKTLLKMESEAPERSPSLESWEEVAPDTPVDSRAQRDRARVSNGTGEWKVPIRVDRTLGPSAQSTISATGQTTHKFKLPAQPVIYTPPGKLRLAVEKQFEVSPKALFHVLFGDKSVVWQLLSHERNAQNLRQGPWVEIGEGRLRREFLFAIPSADTLGRGTLTGVTDYQLVDVQSDHLCYVVTDKRTAWHLPYRHQFRQSSKIVITHVAKSRCKLAVFAKVDWTSSPWLPRLKTIIEQQALNDLELDALDLADVVTDQVRRLGTHSRTRKAVQIFGQLGQNNETTQLQIDRPALNIEMRRLPVERKALDLIWQDVQTASQSALGTLLEGVFALIRWLWNICKAHHIILAVLVFSALLNSWYGSRDALTWWHERQAGNFMSRLGVSPNQVMSKAVYLSDLDELLTQRRELPHLETNTCFSVFHDSYQLDELDAAMASTKTLVPSPAQAVRRSRKRLARYRHDLLVAMKVVNGIEKEILLGEWERWVQEESRRCRQVAKIAPQYVNDSTIVSSSADTVDLRGWYENYCTSCLDESQRLKIA